MSSILKEKNISETPFRKEVFAIFTNYGHAIPLSIIEKELKEYNRITLYRTIKTFLEKGIIHEISLSGDESKYAICQEECTTKAHQHEHIHFKCRECGIVSCVEIDKFPVIKLSKYKIDQVEIQATGFCPKCKA